MLSLSGDVILTIHLKMTGQLFVVPCGAPKDPHTRLVIAFADGRELRFRDIRKFGKVGLFAVDGATGEAVIEPGGAAVFAGLGPEPLEDAFTLRVFRGRLRVRRGRLKSLLLDQSFVAGIGNIYADEALWAARLHPLRSAGTLRPPDERRLYVSETGDQTQDRPEQYIRVFDVSADGPRFLFSERGDVKRASVTRMDLVLNWTTPLATGR